MRFTIPPHRHRPALQQLLLGAVRGFYGISFSLLMRRRVIFHRPNTTGAGGKIFGRSRGLFFPFRRLRYGWDELFKPAHEESDRFSFQCEDAVVVVGTYAYVNGVRPWIYEADSSQAYTLAVLEYAKPYVLTLEFEKRRTRYVIFDWLASIRLADVWVQHEPTPLWWLGKLAGVYQGGGDDTMLNEPYSVDVERL